jgi:hypothetical protein
MPPAAKNLFEKRFLDFQKLLIKAVMVCNLEESMQTMTAFGSFKVRRLKRRLKASIPLLYATSNKLYNIRHFGAFSADSIHLKKPLGGPKALIGPPCHGVEPPFPFWVWFSVTH